MSEVQETILLGAKEIHNLREENKKQKEILDKIKDLFKTEYHEDGCEFCDKLEKLLQEI